LGDGSLRERLPALLTNNVEGGIHNVIFGIFLFWRHIFEQSCCLMCYISIDRYHQISIIVNSFLLRAPLVTLEESNLHGNGLIELNEIRLGCCVSAICSSCRLLPVSNLGGQARPFAQPAVQRQVVQVVDLQLIVLAAIQLLLGIDLVCMLKCQSEFMT
jgi:hypothetical protein